MPFPVLNRHLHKVVYVYIPRDTHINIKLINPKKLFENAVKVGPLRGSLSGAD